MTDQRRWAAPIRYGAWFGLGSGFLETLIRLARKELSGVELHLGAYVFWMPAVANVVLLVVVGAALGALAYVMPRLIRPWLVIGVLAYLAVLNAVWLFSPPLALYAVVALSIGLAVQLTRMIVARLERFDRLVNQSTAVMAALVLILALGIEGSRAWSEHRTLARSPRASAGAPNVLLLVLDTVRQMNLSLYGYYRVTSPNIDSLAQRGVRFDRAISTAPWTLPSHASMFTGRWLHEQSTGWKDPLDDAFPTLAEVLTARGYSTGGFVANKEYCDREYGLARGFAHYEDYTITWKQVLRSSSLGLWLSRQRFMVRRFGPPQNWTRKNAAEVTDEFLGWSAKRTDRPYFAFLNYYDAHRFYYWEWALDSLFRTDSAAAPPVPRTFKELPDTRRFRPQSIQDYDRAIRYIDQEIGRLLRELARRGSLENTIVIVTSDHGEEFWEHGLVGHGNALYYPALGVPLVVTWPAGVPAGRVVREPVSLRNLPATVLDLIDSTDQHAFPGASLAELWNRTPRPDPVLSEVLAEVNQVWNQPDWIPAAKGSMKSVFAGERHLIGNGDGSFELYDLSDDPWQQRDRSSDMLYRGTFDTLRTTLSRVPTPRAVRR